MDKLCIVCGRTFHIRDSHASKRFCCSQKCTSARNKIRNRGENNPHWKGGLIRKFCLYCSKEFKVYPSVVNSRKCCSRKCSQSMVQRDIRISKGLPAEKPIKIKTRIVINKHLNHVCKLCGIALKVAKSYCSNCSPKGKQTITTYCQICGKPFNHWKGYTHKKYCSRTCATKGRIGEGNGNWKGGRKTLAQIIRGSKKNRLLIASIIKRDKYTCQSCKQLGGDLEVDHIKPFSDILEEFLKQYQVLNLQDFTYELSLIALKYKPFWDKKNLRTLCRKCNWTRQIERNKRPSDWESGAIQKILD